MLSFTIDDVKSNKEKLMSGDFPWHKLAPIYENRKGYHDIRHIQALIREINSLGLSEDHTNWLKAVAWLHDAYYDPILGSPENEKFSAELLKLSEFADCFSNYGWKLAYDTILLTAKHNETHTIMEPIQGFFLDVDIAHLGMSYELFIRNSQLISVEYRYVGISDEVLIEGYHKFYQTMLDRQYLYYTENYQTLEKSARNNLKRALNETTLIVSQPQSFINKLPEGY